MGIIALPIYLSLSLSTLATTIRPSFRSPGTDSEALLSPLLLFYDPAGRVVAAGNVEMKFLRTRRRARAAPLSYRSPSR